MAVECRDLRDHGEPRTSHALAATGRIEERTSRAVARAAAMFRTSLPPYCPEVF